MGVGNGRRCSRHARVDGQAAGCGVRRRAGRAGDTVARGGAAARLAARRGAARAPGADRGRGQHPRRPAGPRHAHLWAQLPRPRAAAGRRLRARARRGDLSVLARRGARGAGGVRRGGRRGGAVRRRDERRGRSRARGRRRTLARPRPDGLRHRRRPAVALGAHRAGHDGSRGRGGARRARPDHRPLSAVMGVRHDRRLRGHTLLGAGLHRLRPLRRARARAADGHAHRHDRGHRVPGHRGGTVAARAARRLRGRARSTASR